MPIRRRSLLSSLCLAALVQVAQADPRASGPEGFRGMKWGDPVARLPNAIAVSNPPGCYGNRREEMRLGDAQLFGVLYCFENDRLNRIELRSATGEDNLKAFQEAVVKVFGQPLPPAPGTSRHVQTFTLPEAPVSVTLVREVLGVHKYLLIMESRKPPASGGAQGGAAKETEARKDFGF